MNREGFLSLRKIRTYSYIIFLFELFLLVHGRIAGLFDTTDRKILYGLILLIFFQVTICTLHIVKYVTTVGQKNKKRKEIIMHTSRIMVFFVGMYLVLALLIANDAIYHNYYVDKILIVSGILMLFYVLKNLTILEHQRY